MITRISLIPFDLGGDDFRTYQNILKDEGFSEWPLGDMDKRLVGLDVRRWKSSDFGSDRTIYVERSGFGVLVDREATEASFGDHASIANLLEQRWQFHNQVLQGGHDISRRVENLRGRLNGDFGNTARWSIWRGVPYIFTFYVAEEETPDEVLKDPDSRLGIVALSEPSRLGFGGTEARDECNSVSQESVESQIASLNPMDLPSDIETNQRIFCGATWASLVIVGRYGDPGSTADTYELLEVRTQITWAAAYQVRHWCEGLLTRDEAIGSGDLHKVRKQVLPFLRQTGQLSEASMSTRHTEILSALKETSGLEQEVEAAESALQLTYEGAEHNEVRRRHRYEVAVAVLLGILAVFQLATLIHEGPLVSLPTWIATIILISISCVAACLFARSSGK